jgi:sporulation integral membrane protein YlbJ
MLFNTSGYGAYAFIMSIFAGYPSGAKIVSQLIADKKITPEEGQKILTFSSTSGPLFIIGAVGTGMLGSVNFGYILFLSHFIGSIANGIFSRLFFKHSEFTKTKNIICCSSKTAKGDLLSESIKTSLYTCGIIGGYIIIFSVIIRLLDSISFFKILIFYLKFFLNLSYLSSETVCTFIKSVFEISNGCRILSQSALSLSLKLIFISFIISFSGLSIIGQVSSIINNVGIKLQTYILFKITHGIFSAFACFILLRSKISVPAFFSGIFSKTNIPYNIVLYIIIYLAIILFLNIAGSIFKSVRNQ